MLASFQRFNKILVRIFSVFIRILCDCKKKNWQQQFKQLGVYFSTPQAFWRLVTHDWYGDFMIPSTYLCSVFLQVAFTFMTVSQSQQRDLPSRLQTVQQKGGRKERRKVWRWNRQEKARSKKNVTPKIPQQISIRISLAVAGSFLPTRETGKYF